MTNRLVWATLLAAFALAWSALPVHAHGAAAAREIDNRVLQDDDGLVGFGGCVEEACQPAFPAEGLDLLALDVREAYLAGQPAVVFRIMLQWELDHDGRAVRLALQANGQPFTFNVDNGDGTTFGASNFDRLDGPFDVGDGHPKAIDGWAWLSTLGVAPGDSLSDITVTSTHHDEPDDVMPGGWYLQGLELQHIPAEPDPGELTATPEPGAYTIAGPAPLLTVTAPTTAVDLAAGPAAVKVSVANPLATLPQFVTATLVTAGATANLDAAGLNLDPGTLRELTITVPATSESGNATLLLTSDLGAQSIVEIAIQAAPPLVCIDYCNGDGPQPGEDEQPDKSTPGLSLPAIALTAMALAALARSRTPRQPL